MTAADSDLPRYRHVLVGVDGSAASLFAVRHAIRFGLIDRSLVTLVAVVAPPSAYAAVAGYAPQQLADDAERAADEQLRSLVASVPDDLTIRTVVRRGSAADEILAAIDELHADVVCVGARGRRRLASALLGSVSADLMHRSPVPVVVIHPPRCPDRP